MTISSTRYFTSYRGIRLPLTLVGELAADSMRHRNTYYIGHYDEAGRLLRCEKRVYGEVEFSHDYEYHDDGRLALAVIDHGDEAPQRLSYPPATAPNN